MDTADGWEDEWDDDETVSNYSGGDQESTVSSLPRRHTNSGMVRTGTVRKSMNRFSHFVKSGGEAYVIGTQQTDVKVPHNERVSIK